MAARGDLTNKRNIKLALYYANKLSNNDSEDDGVSACKRDLLISKINSIDETTDNDSLSYMALEWDANPDDRHNMRINNDETISTLWNYYTDIKYKSLLQQLDKTQSAKLEYVMEKYKKYEDSYIDQIVIPCSEADIGAQGETGYINSSTEDIQKQFVDIIDRIKSKNLVIGNITTKDNNELDTQLNNQYKVLLKAIKNNIKSPPQRTITMERNWIKYKEAFIQLAESYYKNTYKPNDIDLAINQFLTKNQLTTLTDDTNLLDNLQACDGLQTRYNDIS